jgi:hypothetical protein
LATDYKVRDEDNSNSPIEHRDDQIATWLQLLMLEYQKGAERYDNIYRAVWQNFSYMAVLSAAILTFGAKELSPPFLTFVALIPLVFWFLATFLPMDSYGEKTRSRLAAMEQQLNDIYFPKKGDPQLSHFLEFRQKTDKATETPWRVKTAVYVFGAVAIIACCIAFVLSVKAAHITRNELAPAAITIGPNSSVVTLRTPQLEKLEVSVQALANHVEHLDSLSGVEATQNDTLRALVVELARRTGR